MRVVDKEVYLVGYRNSDTDDWLTSGKIFFNSFDAEWEIKDLKIHAPKWQYKLFKGGRFQ